MIEVVILDIGRALFHFQISMYVLLMVLQRVSMSWFVILILSFFIQIPFTGLVVLIDVIVVIVVVVIVVVIIVVVDNIEITIHMIQV